MAASAFWPQSAVAPMTGEFNSACPFRVLVVRKRFGGGEDWLSVVATN
jgi:hypothetical protein